MAGSDIALICNNNSSYTVTEQLVRLALKLRKYKPLFIIDLGAPEAVEPTVENFDSAFIYNLENLEQLAVEGIEKRLLEKQEAERIISEFNKPNIVEQQSSNTKSPSKEKIKSKKISKK